MSQLAPVRPLPRTSPRRAAPTPRQLKVVAPPEVRGNGVFLALCVTLLLGGFVGVLMLNTAMAKGSYTTRDLQHRSDELTDRQDALRHTISGLSGPGPLAKRARELGMVPAATPAFLRLSDGKVLGVATKAKQDTTFSVVTESTAPTRSTHVPTTSATKPSAPPASTATPTTPSPANTPAATPSPASTPAATPSPANTPAPTKTKPPVADPAPTN